MLIMMWILTGELLGSFKARGLGESCGCFALVQEHSQLSRVEVQSKDWVTPPDGYALKRR
jgi:hypothetical protein